MPDELNPSCQVPLASWQALSIAPEKERMYFLPLTADVHDGAKPADPTSFIPSAPIDIPQADWQKERAVHGGSFFKPGMAWPSAPPAPDAPQPHRPPTKRSGRYLVTGPRLGGCRKNKYPSKHLPDLPEEEEEDMDTAPNFRTPEKVRAGAAPTEVDATGVACSDGPQCCSPSHTSPTGLAALGLYRGEGEEQQREERDEEREPPDALCHMMFHGAQLNEL